MKKILILGGSGLVGSRFIELHNSEFSITSPSHHQLDLLNQTALQSFITASEAEVVINFAAITNVDQCEAELNDKGGMVYQLNTQSPKNLAEICQTTNKHLMHISTDYVFDGTKKTAPYLESEPRNPVNWYGQTKAMAEEFIEASGASFTIIRPEMPYSATFTQRKDFARFFLAKFKSGNSFQSVRDQKITPIFVDSCVNAIAKLAETQSPGIYHVASTDAITPYEFATILARISNELKLTEKSFDPSLVMSVAFSEFNKGRTAPRPQNSWLDTTKFTTEFGPDLLLSTQAGIKSFIQTLKSQPI